MIDGDYSEAPDIAATWFIDPPYERAGSHYFHSELDYERLSAWCRSRRGQVMVCENDGAAWLPFAPFHTGEGDYEACLFARGFVALIIWYGPIVEWLVAAFIVCVLLDLVGCSTPAALVATDVPLCPDRVWELIALECPGLDELTCDAVGSHCAALEEMR